VALPEYMVPSAIVPVDSLPLTLNGKVDRKALPAPDYAALASRQPPRSATEELLCALFAEVLGIPSAGVDDDFFDLGGNSLLVMRLISRIRSELDAEVDIQVFFQAPTVAGIRRSLDVSANALRLPFRPMARPARLPLSFAQSRLWFLYRFEGVRAAYNIPLIWRLSGSLDPNALKVALTDVVERHESLRTIFPEEDGMPYQLVMEAREF